MIRSISVGLLVPESLLDFATQEFPDLMTHPDVREDALQELRMVELGETLEPDEKREIARVALAHLAYELGMRAQKPTRPRADYLWLRDSVAGTLVRDLDLAIEAGRLAA